MPPVKAISPPTRVYRTRPSNGKPWNGVFRPRLTSRLESSTRSV